jgi:hypothetical protein
MMFSYPSARASVWFSAACALALLFSACGSGGGSGANSGGSGGTPPSATTPSQQPGATHPPGSPAATLPAKVGTATPAPTGVAPSPTPTATDVPTPVTLTVFSGQSIAAVAKNAPDGAIVVVAPGTYGPVVLKAGDLHGSVTLFADVTGEFTNGPAAPVTIDATSTGKAAFDAAGQSGLGVDGFTLRGGTRAAFLCSDCSGVTVQDCVVSGSHGDAVRFERSDAILVFNNLLIGNKGGGVTALGTTNLQIIGNTIYSNKADGVRLTLDNNQNPSTNAFVTNNILNKNATGIVVDLGPPTSLDGFSADFNLNTDGYSGNDPAPNDVVADPLFIFPAGGDFHLAPGSQAIDGGTDAIDPDLVSQLEQLTTQTDGTLDALPLDLGYHSIAPIPTPTRAPKATRTPTPTAKRSQTAAPAVGTTTPGGTPTPTVKKTKKPTKTPTITPTPRPTP